MIRHSGFLLAFIGGFVDTATYVQFSGLFSAHVTGNFVVFAAALGRGVIAEDWLKLIAFPVFLISVSVATLIYDHFSGKERLLFAAEALVLAVVGAIALAPVSLGARGQATLAMVLVAAMGWQNAGHRLDRTLGPTSAVMTTNVTQFIVTLSRAMVGWLPMALSTQSKNEEDSLFKLIVGFGIGCFTSVYMTRALKLGSVLLPAALLAAFVIVRQIEWMRTKAPKAPSGSM
ncbi:MAG: YoaK family protein [Methylovirgula sp.]